MTRNKVFRDEVRLNWLPDGEAAWYRVQTAQDQHQFVLVDATRGKKQPAFDHGKLAALLTKQTGKTYDANRLPFRAIRFSQDQKEVFFQLTGQEWQFSRETHQLKQAGTGETKPEPESTVRQLSRPERSARTGEEVYLTFRNQTAGKVTLYWLNRDGKRQFYETIEPRQKYVRRTFDGHNWEVVNQQGKTVGIYQAGKSEAMVRIDGSWKPDIRRPIRRRRSRTSLSPNSPDEKWRVTIEEQNVFLVNRKTDERIQLSTDGKPEDAYQSRFYWSPDSTRLIVLRTRPGAKREVHIVESSPRDQVQPKLRTFNYTKPGDVINRDRPTLFNIAERKQIPIADGPVPQSLPTK